MAYRLFEIHTAVGDDANLTNAEFNRFAVLPQINDLIVAPATARIATNATETAINLGTLVQGYSFALFSDYPVLVRLNGPSATQFQLTSTQGITTNIGAPSPPLCCFVATILVTSVRLAPIAGATQTATVWLCCTGDPSSSYT